eukprot:TRINITY_DN2479_c0_g1_i1.p1 TRINITY_DN2479_c0_g1~~TRINITY_DN2479_c0_g1_i1.p1  ORF type:complete len:117 (+),score=9.93 TRINITY_DN2479_c0_g1_i1:410-760(+)
MSKTASSGGHNGPSNFPVRFPEQNFGDAFPLGDTKAFNCNYLFALWCTPRENYSAQHSATCKMKSAIILIAASLALCAADLQLNAMSSSQFIRDVVSLEAATANFAALACLIVLLV